MVPESFSIPIAPGRSTVHSGTAPSPTRPTRWSLPTPMTTTGQWIPSPATRRILVHPSTATVGPWAITGVDVAHDDEGGRSRGRNTIVVLDDGDVRLAHLGDLGHTLDAPTVAAIGRVDVLLVPVGGFFTIDHKQAADVVESLAPLVVIPMHYKTPKVDFPIATVEAFLATQDSVERKTDSTIEVTRQTLPAERVTYVLQPALEDRTVAIPPMQGSTAKPKKAPKPAKPGRILRLKPGPLRRFVIIVIALVVFFGLGSLLSRIWTNYLWYAEVGQTEVFWTPFVARICVGLFFAVVFFAIFYGNLWLARKISPRLLAVKDAGDAGHPRTQAEPAVARPAATADRGGPVDHHRRSVQQPLGRGPPVPEPRLLRLRRSAVRQGRLLLRVHPAAMEDARQLRRHDPALHLRRNGSHLCGRPGAGAERAQPGAAGAARQGPSLRDPGPRDGRQGRRLHDPELVARLLHARGRVRGQLHRRARLAPGAPLPGHRVAGGRGDLPGQHPLPGMEAAGHSHRGDVPHLGPRRQGLPGHHPAVQGLTQRDHRRDAPTSPTTSRPPATPSASTRSRASPTRPPATSPPPRSRPTRRLSRACASGNRGRPSTPTSRSRRSASTTRSPTSTSTATLSTATSGRC